ncbi:MAG: ABC transporter substrate-binding protein [Oscillospiraceae bacterium]|nr:ABC transporter substrate-binding protein [Oscillospiraceae bacterium]
MNRTIERIISIILILCLLFNFSACSVGAEMEKKGETKTVVDFLGREVEIPKEPKKVACLYASIAHMACLLDETDKVVGCPTGIKRDVLMQKKFPNYESLSVPYASGSINVEELIKIDADLVLIRNSTAQAAAEVEKLEKLGIPYVVVDYFSLDELRYAISLMGEIFNKEDEAKSYIEYFDNTLKLVDDVVSKVPESERVSVYHAVNEALRTDVYGDLCTSLIERAGLVSVSAANSGALTSEGDKSFTTLEEIYKWNPDAIIANEYTVADYILTDSKWVGLDAVKNKMVYTLPVGATRWCHPGSIEAHVAVLSMAYMFYSSYFEDFDMYSYIHDYYNDFWGFDFDDDTITMILSGEGMRIAK